MAGIEADTDDEGCTRIPAALFLYSDDSDLRAIAEHLNGPIDESALDMTLVAHLACFSASNLDQMRRLFLASNRGAREKVTARDDHLDRTLAMAADQATTEGRWWAGGGVDGLAFVEGDVKTLEELCAALRADPDRQAVPLAPFVAALSEGDQREFYAVAREHRVKTDAIEAVKRFRAAQRRKENEALGYVAGADGQIIPNALSIAVFLARDVEFAGPFGFDGCDGFDRVACHRRNGPWEPITDAAENLLLLFVPSNPAFHGATLASLRVAIDSVCRAYRFHPIRDYL